MALPTSRDFQELIECAICKLPVTNPRMLECQHSFCCSCLKTYNKFQPGEILEMPCPICRRITPLPNRRVSQLPPDYKLRRLSELVNQPEPSKSYSCVVCSNSETGHIKADYYCQTCQDYMCKACGETHRRAQIFATHEVVNIAKKKYCLKNLCKRHPTKLQEYYCEHCKILVCSACVTGQHQQHSVSNVQRCIDYQSEIIKKLLLKLEEVPRRKISTIPTDNEYSDHVLDSIEATILETETKIKRHADKVINDLRKEEENMIHALHAHRESLISLLTGQGQKSFYELTQQCQSHLHPLEVLQSYKGLIHKINSAMQDSAPKCIREILTEFSFSYDFCPENPVALGSLKQVFLKDLGQFGERQKHAFITENDKISDNPSSPRQSPSPPPPALPPRQLTRRAGQFRPPPPRPKWPLSPSLTDFVVARV